MNNNTPLGRGVHQAIPLLCISHEKRYPLYPADATSVKHTHQNEILKEVHISRKKREQKMQTHEKQSNCDNTSNQCVREIHIHESDITKKKEKKTTKKVTSKSRSREKLPNSLCHEVIACFELTECVRPM